MARAGAHRVVDHHHRQRGDRFAAGAEQIHLADFFVEWTTFERDRQRTSFVAAVFFLKAARAGVLLPLVAVDAVVRLVRDLARRHARIGEFEAVAPPEVIGLTCTSMDEMVVHHRFGQAERRPMLEASLLPLRCGPFGQHVDEGVDGRGFARDAFVGRDVVLLHDGLGKPTRGAQLVAELGQRGARFGRRRGRLRAARIVALEVEQPVRGDGESVLEVALAVLRAGERVDEDVDRVREAETVQ